MRGKTAGERSVHRTRSPLTGAESGRKSCSPPSSGRVNGDASGPLASVEVFVCEPFGTADALLPSEIFLNRRFVPPRFGAFLIGFSATAQRVMQWSRQVALTSIVPERMKCRRGLL